MNNQIGRWIKNGIGYGMALAGFFAGSDKAPGTPVAIAIEPTNICNLHCPLCATGAGKLNRPKGSMNYGDFRRIIDMLPQSVTDVYLWGQGEPFMAPDFLGMVEYASFKGLRTFVSTNGHFLNNSKKIVHSGMYCLILSLDGADEKTYESYRTGGDFNLVVSGIKDISETKKSIGHGPVLELQYLVTRKNSGEMDTFRSFAREIGADRVVFKTLQAASMEDGFSYLPDNKMLTRYRKQKNGMIETEKRWFLRNRCLRIYYSFQIDWQGNILPCCFDKDSNYRMGNVYNDTISGIWNSEKFRSFRNMFHKKGRILPMCKDCTEGLKRMKLHG